MSQKRFRASFIGYSLNWLFPRVLYATLTAPSYEPSMSVSSANVPFSTNAVRLNFRTRSWDESTKWAPPICSNRSSCSVTFWAPSERNGKLMQMISRTVNGTVEIVVRHAIASDALNVRLDQGVEVGSDDVLMSY
ncbi:uncharacterized protein LOC119767644 [Culex quinquefasciatus]|uniref:uncharacterized protein LOC119767644 n=1 Tax=Culex quinquefasciatus TaxID=7176 RepID=UPI0018E33008|nr:uncharacterized protein LOC119767644 [Culex quinquefasciatus]